MASEIELRPLVTEPESSPQNHELRLTSTHRRIHLVALVPTVVIFCLTAGLATVILAWLLNHQVTGIEGYEPTLIGAIRNGTFLVDEGTKRPHHQVHGASASATPVTPSASLTALTISSAAVSGIPTMPCETLTNYIREIAYQSLILSY